MTDTTDTTNARDAELAARFTAEALTFARSTFVTADWTVRICLPAALDKLGVFPEHAAALRALDPITDKRSAQSAWDAAEAAEAVCASENAAAKGAEAARSAADCAVEVVYVSAHAVDAGARAAWIEAQDAAKATWDADGWARDRAACVARLAVRVGVCDLTTTLVADGTPVHRALSIASLIEEPATA